MTDEIKPKKITERILDLEKSINSVLENVNSLIKTIENIEKKLIVSTPPILPSALTPSVYKDSQQSSLQTEKYPVPLEYREIIDTVLNHSFGISIIPSIDQPAFTLNIIVPEKYSNMTDTQRDMYKVDIRTKVINYAEGSNGVRAYAELVANNLGPERRAMIITDRANLQ